MKKNLLRLALCALLLALSVSVRAQQPKKIPRIGVLVAGSASVASQRIKVFQQGLRDLGYVEEQNVTIESRSAEGIRRGVCSNS